MPRHQRTRGEQNVRWIESFCVTPAGPRKNLPVQLSFEQRETVLRIYDGLSGIVEALPTITGELGAYLALLHVCGPEYSAPLPPITVDIFSIWAASENAALRCMLKRAGEHVVCPELGTSFPPSPSPLAQTAFESLTRCLRNRQQLSKQVRR